MVPCKQSGGTEERGWPFIEDALGRGGACPGQELRAVQHAHARHDLQPELEQQTPRMREASGLATTGLGVAAGVRGGTLRFSEAACSLVGACSQ